MSFELFAQIQDASEAARQVLEQTQTAPVIPQETTLSVWELIMMGGWYIMGPLALMSLIAVYIIIERTMAINRALKDEKDFMAKIRDYIHEGKIDSARNLCQTSNTPVARMLEKGI
ncbi:MAG: MotA/TolQ/ExbB proton channel family protein, partial [Flavobacteriales bacterium]|nr:MotA/TolQ/ExbB proton channel family protein [Flavobacteriales bacterium]